MHRSKRGLAGAGTADDHHGLALPNLEVDAAQHMVVAEVLLEAFGPHDRLAEWEGRLSS